MIEEKKKQAGKMAKKPEINWKEIVTDLSTTQEERIQAAFHLENEHNVEAVKALEKALAQEPSPIVRHELAFALGETGMIKEAAPVLVKAIQNDNDEFVVHEALLAISTLGDKSYIPFIEKWLADPNPHISESAEIALQRLRFTGSK